MATWRPGELDQRVKILRRNPTPDDMGGNTVTFDEINEVWAKVMPKGGRERTDQQRVNADAGYLFVVRNGLDIIDSDLIEWDGDTYDVRFRGKPSTRDLYLEIDGQRGEAQ